MATAKQAEASRRNGRKSSGPKTAEGKDRSRFNAVKHGMTAKRPVLPGEDETAYQGRVEAWKADLQPRGTVEDYLVERAARVSWQLDRVERAHVARLSSVIRHAPDEQENRRQDEAIALGERLFRDRRGPAELYPHFPLRDQLLAERKPRTSFSGLADDPDDPARLVLRLESTAPGCQWMLARWLGLRELLDEKLVWQSPDRLKAIRLLGKQPMDAADDPTVTTIYLACWAMDPRVNEIDAFEDVWNELLSGEANLFRQRLTGRYVEEYLPENAEAARDRLLSIVVDAIERLKRLIAAHEEHDEADRADLAARLSFDDSDEGERLRRYELACGRTLIRTLNLVLKVRKDGGGTVDDRSQPDPASPIEIDVPALGTIPDPGDTTPPAQGVAGEALSQPAAFPRRSGEVMVPSMTEPATMTVHQDIESCETNPTNEVESCKTNPKIAGPRNVAKWSRTIGKESPGSNSRGSRTTRIVGQLRKNTEAQKARNAPPEKNRTQDRPRDS